MSQIHSSGASGLAPSLSARIPSRLDASAPVLDEIVARCTAAGYPRFACRFGIRYAVDEAIRNAMEHGNGWAPDREVSIAAEVTPEKLVVDITDEGPGFDLKGTIANRAQMRDQLAVHGFDDEADYDDEQIERGRGLLTISGYMSSVETLDTDGNGNTVRLVYEPAQADRQAANP